MKTRDFCVVHQTPGRVRFKAGRLRSNEGFARQIKEALSPIVGIRTVEANPSTSSVLVLYDRDRLTSLESLLALQAAFARLFPDVEIAQLRAFLDPPGNGSSPGRTVPPPRSAIAGTGGANLAVAEAAGALDLKTSAPIVSLHCSVVHSMPGRLRLCLDGSSGVVDPFEGCARFLRTQPGVTEVQSNSSCRSIVITYDPTQQSAEGLIRAVQTAPPDQLQPSPSTQANPDSANSSEDTWLPLTLSSIAVGLGLLAETTLAPWLTLGAAIPIFGRALDALWREGKLGVDSLDASATAVLLMQGQVPTAAAMVWLVSLGHVIAEATSQQSTQAIEGLFDGRVRSAWLVRNGEKVQVKAEDVQVGDQVVVYPGELIPVDGTVASGKATVDQMILTGESMPVEKQEGHQVFASTVVREGKLYLEATKVGRETMAARIIRLIREAPPHETRVQNYAEHFADTLVPWTYAAAGAAYVGAANVNRAAGILIVDYATGIRIAAPTTVLAAMTKAARHGILIKGGRFLEKLAEVDAIVFDKTGTLTQGTQQIVRIIPYRQDVSEERLLAVAAAAEQRLTHPVAEAIVRSATARGIPIPERETSEYAIGQGIEARVNGYRVHVGCHRYMETKGIRLDRAAPDLAWIDAEATSPVFVAINRKLAGILTYSDPIRPEAPAVIRGLRERGVREVVMLTGDRPAVARRVADEIGITRFVADALPEQKASLVQELQAQGRVVAVVGDGINDSPALARADVGIAVRGGADVARETAHVAFLEGNLGNIPRAIDISREALGLIQQNWDLLFYANSLAIVLALPGLLGAVGTTLISNGAGIAAAVNALRPLLWEDKLPRPRRE
jgi:Cu2+-exporting ATPase